MWKEEIGNKSTLEIYRTFKTEMEQENSYDGRPDSTIWFRARTNCLTLGDRNRHIGGTTECFMCGEEVEDLRHFILDCKELEEVRADMTRLQRPRLEDWREVIGEFLYGKEKERSKRELYGLWKARERRRREITEGSQQ